MIDHKESVTVNGQLLRNHSLAGYTPKTESRAIPASPYIIELDERIAAGSNVAVTIDSVPAEIRPWTFAVQAGEVALDRERGFLKFNSADVGLTAACTYTPIGTNLTPAKVEQMVPSSGAFQPVDSDLTAVAALSSTGLIARTGSGTAAVRTITGTSNDITVTNGNGVSGNPTIAAGSNIPKLNAANTWTGDNLQTFGGNITMNKTGTSAAPTWLKISNAAFSYGRFTFRDENQGIQSGAESGSINCMQMFSYFCCIIDGNRQTVGVPAWIAYTVPTADNVITNSGINTTLATLSVYKKFGHTGALQKWEMESGVGTPATVATMSNTGAFSCNGAITFGGGATVQKVLTNTAALNFASIAANSTGTLNMTVTGAAAGDVVELGAPSTIETGLTWSGYVSAADTVTIRLHNGTAGAIDPASATWRAKVTKF